MFSKLAFLLAVPLVLLSAFASAQDIILKRTGEELSVKVKSVSDSVIVYSTVSQNDSIQSEITNQINVAEVAVIKYASGKRISFVEPLASEKPPVVPTQKTTTLTAGEFYNKGRGDAVVYYQGYKGAATGTLIVGLLSPLAGLIPAIACSSTRPSPYRIVTPDAKMLSNAEYQHGYLQEARRIKSRHVWKNWGIAFGVNLALVLVLAN